MQLKSEGKCNKHGCDKVHIGSGTSAHPSNWVCPQCEKEGLPMSSGRVRDAYIAELKQELSRLRAENTALALSNEKLREALEIADIELDPNTKGLNCECEPTVGYVCPCCKWVTSKEYKIIKKALSQPSNTSLIDEHRRKVLENEAREIEDANKGELTKLVEVQDCVAILRRSASNTKEAESDLEQARRL